MRLLTISLIITVIAAIPLIYKNRKVKLLPIFTDENKRYDINDYLEDIGL